MPSQREWRACNACGINQQELHDQLTQRYPVVERVRFKMKLQQCGHCAERFHTEKEFLMTCRELVEHLEPDQDGARLALLFGDLSLGNPDVAEVVARCWRQDLLTPVKDLPPVDPDFLFSFEDIAQLDQTALLWALQELPGRHRVLLALYLLGYRSYEHLATLTEIPEEQVRQDLYDALKVVQSLLF